MVVAQDDVQSGIEYTQRRATDRSLIWNWPEGVFAKSNVGCLSTCQFRPSRLVGLVVGATGGAKRKAAMLGPTVCSRLSSARIDEMQAV